MDFAKLDLLLVLLLVLNGPVCCRRPEVVNIAAVLTYDSVIGRVAKTAIEVAVGDVNSDKNVLVATQLNLTMENSDCNGFIGTIAALKAVEKDVVAIIGPQSSTIAHVISFISNGLQIPLVSFAATDPTLSSLQYPFFVRTTQSDSYQMKAMADLIYYYGWRKVIGLYVDNEYGRNGIYSLGDELANKRSKIYKIALPLGTSQDYMMNALRDSRNLGPRVYVVHATPDSGLEIFSVAQQLNMMTDEYVWLVTDWLCTALNTPESVVRNSLSHLQGIVGICQYIPISSQKSVFMAKWKELRRKGIVDCELNAYGFYAYDTVWAIARAINDFLNDSGNVTFTPNENLMGINGNLHFDKLKSFDGGHLLLQKLLQLNFAGLTGKVQFDSDQNLISRAYQVINIVDDVMHTVGYWSNHTGLCNSVPDSFHLNDPRNSCQNQIVGNVTWAGGKTRTPRGWVIAKPLCIGIPRRVSFVEFVTLSEANQTVQGYCIDVFKAALKFLPYDVPYKFIPFGDGHSTPKYWKLVNMVVDREFDAAVGDISIVKNRTRIVDFTQPFMDTGLVIVVPVKSIRSNTWVFLRPFSAGMWCVTGAFFVLIGIVMWLLEHRVNNDFRGSPKRQCLTIFLFSFSTLFHSQQEDTLSALGKFVMLVWSFLILVITSSYTASLTSFLTVQQLSSPISGIDSLIASNDPIGYQESSFARVYMIDALKINPSRLISLRTPEDYAEKLDLGPKNGGVAAIVDEFPYVELFLKKYQGYGTVGPKFTRSGWGFAFPRGSPLAIDLSNAILKLSENGELQNIRKKWLCNTSCTTQTAERAEPDQLHLRNFWGLYLICGIAFVVSLFLFLFSSIRQFVRYKSMQRDPNKPSSKGLSYWIFSFFDFLDEKEEAIKNMFKQQQNNVSRPEIDPSRCNDASMIT